MRLKNIFIGLLLVLMCFTACRKWIILDNPKDSLTFNKIFENEKYAEGALIGIYNSLIHSRNTSNEPNINISFAGGLSTLASGKSAGEIINVQDRKSLWQLNRFNGGILWSSAYDIVYLSNLVIEGLSSEYAHDIRDSVKNQFIAEAKFWRAFSFLHLTNYFGDVPLTLVSDFNATKLMKRTPKVEVYNQIIQDLKDAAANLPSTYPSQNGHRIRVNKWGALALLARVYLFQSNYQLAEQFATEVINQTQLFQLEPLKDVFLINSREAIVQLSQTNIGVIKNATPEGNYFLPNPLQSGRISDILSNDLLTTFENGDNRKQEWINFTLQNPLNEPENKVWFPYKYKTGIHNAVLGAPVTEYYMVIRLAEMYLIRAEARIFSGSGRQLAIEDLNKIRFRAGLKELSSSLSDTELKEALWKERRLEFVAEWDHYWFDLIRNGKAVKILSALPNNLPWQGDWQLLFPIPTQEILNNPNLTQNPGYSQMPEE